MNYLRLIPLALLLILAKNGFSGQFYWVGNSGNWSDFANHWATSSGGTTFHTTSPSSLDTVWIDNNSFSTTNQFITFDAQLITVANFNCSPTNLPALVGLVQNELRISGDCTIENTLLNSYASRIALTGGGNHTVNISSTLNNKLSFSNLGSYQVLALTSNKTVEVVAGDVSFQDLAIGSFVTTGSLSKTIQFNADLSISDDSLALDLTGLNTTISSFPLNVYATYSDSNYVELKVNSLITNTLSFLNKKVTLNGSFTCVNLDVANVNTLILSESSVLRPTAFNFSGQCGEYRALKGLGAGAFIDNNGSSFNFNFVALSGISELSGTQDIASNSVDLGNNSGITINEKKYYWVNNGGNWSDLSHWSSVSGGSVSPGCLPSYYDKIIFDNNSFTTANQTVLLNIVDTVYSLDWSGATNNPTFFLDSNLILVENVTFSNNMIVTYGSDLPYIGLEPNQNNAELTTNNCEININLFFKGENLTDTLFLKDDLNMVPDSTALFIGGGTIVTNDHKIVTNSMTTAFPTTKKMVLGASVLEIQRGIVDSVFQSNLILDAGNSLVKIGGDSIPANLIYSTSGLDFHDVVLITYRDTVLIEGNNSFHRLTLKENTRLMLASGSEQTITNDFLLESSCTDSISLFSTQNGVRAKLNLQVDIDTTIALNLRDIEVLGIGSLTAYLSIDEGNCSGITFDSTPIAALDFTLSDDYCFGDTVEITNNTHSFFWNTSEYEMEYNFGDTLGFVSDTNQHVFQVPDTNNITLRVTHINTGCSTSLTQNYKVRDPILYLTATSDTNVCSNEQVTFNLISFPDSSYNCEFFYNNISTSPAAIDNKTFSILGIDNLATVYAVGNDGGCLTYTDTLEFSSSVSPTTTISYSSDFICADDSVEISTSGADLYQFFKNDAPFTLFTPNSTQTLLNLNNQDTLFIIGKDTLSECADTTQHVIITVNDLPTVNLTSSDTDNVICDGDEVVFQASGTDEYDFLVDGISQNGFGLGSFTTSSLQNGETVSVIGRSTFGCKQEALEQYTYLVNSIPVLSLTTNDIDTSICVGTSVLFNASGALLYEYFVDGVSQNSPSSSSFISTSSLTDNAQIYVEGTSNNCVGFSDTIIYEVIDLPNLVLTSSDADNIICQGDAVDFTATGATNYEFTINGTNPINNTSGLYSNAGLFNGQTIAVEASENGCSISESITMTVNPKPSVNFFTTESDFTICEGESIEFIASNATTYEFFINGVSLGTPSTQNTLNTNNLPVGSAQVYVIGYNNFDCFDISDTITIAVNPLPVLTFSSSDINNTICENENVVFTATGANNYQFLVNGISQGLPTSNSTFNTNNLSDGDVVSVTGISLGCSSTASSMFTMTVNPNPTVTLVSDDNDNAFCEGDGVILTAGGATNYEFFLNTVSNGVASPTNTLNAALLPAGSYVVDVVGEQSTCTGTAQIALTIFGSASVNLVSSDVDNTICAGQNVQFSGSGASLYEFFVNGNSQGAPTTLPTFNTTTLADGDVVFVEASTSQGCSVNSTSIVTSVLPTPTVNLSSSIVSSSICDGDLIDFTASGATTYEFFVDGISVAAANTTAVYSTDTLTTGDVISVLGNIGQCAATSTTTFTYTVFDNPIVTLTNPDDNNLCVGELSNLVASGANTYQFSINGVPQGTFAASNTFANALNNGDQITVQGELNSCVSAAAQTITYNVIPFPTTSLASSDADSEICKGETVTFTASGASVYSFFIDGIQQVNTSANTLTTDQLNDGSIVVVSGFNGDCQTTAPTAYTFTVNEMDLDVSAQPSNYMICEGEAFQLTATGGDNYEFFINGVSQGAISPTSTFTTSNLVEGNFIAFVASNNTTGCVQNYANTIYPTVNSNPVLIASGPTTFCENDSVALVSNTFGTIEWYVDGAIIPNENDTVYTAQNTGNYYFDFISGGNDDVFGMGYNANGELGVGNNFNTASPTQATVISNVQSIEAGDEFGGAITTTGALYLWGQNNTGQLGNGTYTSTNNPILISGVPALNALSLGSEHTAVVSTTGAVFTWGQNDFGQLGIGNTLTVNTPQLVTGLNNMIDVACGKSHTLFLRNDGTVWSVGNNDFGQLGNGTLLSSAVPTQITGLSGVVAIEVGEYHSIAITTTGNVYVWGNNTVGQLGLGDLSNRLIPTLSALKDIVDADGGATHSLLLNLDGEVFAAGGNTYGQLGTGDQINRDIPVRVSGLNGVQAVSAGQYHSIALKQDYSVWGFGRNDNDQLGILSNTSIVTASRLTQAKGVTEIAAGKEFTQFIYGLSNTCSSNTITINELPAPVPVINLSNGTLVSSETADNYQWYIDGVDIINSNSISQIPSQNGNYIVENTYANGCTQASAPYILNNLGLESEKVYVTVYPNPVTDVLAIYLTQGEIKSLSIYDVAGRLIYLEQEVENKIEINTVDWEKGVYIIRVNTNLGKTEKRIVKQ